MKFSSQPTAYWAAAMLTMILAGALQAQSAPDKPTLQAEVYQVVGPLTPAQQQGVEAYVGFHVDQLVAGSDAQVVEARSQLVAPLEKGGTDDFKTHYAATVTRLLGGSQAMTSRRQPYPPENPDAAEQRGGVIVRLNCMVVVERLHKDEQAGELILKGLTDADAAVRYWAVRAARGNPAQLDPALRNRLVEALRTMVGSEQSDDVLRVLLGSLIDLEEVDLVSQALNELIRLHIGKAAMTYDAKREAMKGLLQKLLTLNAQSKPVEPQMRQLARAACRYMILITQQAQGAALDADTLADHIEMVRLSDFVLRTVHEQLKSTSAPPASIQAGLAQSNWSALQAAALAWRQILAQPPFNFTDVDLAPAGG